ncbi:MAG: LamG domain-containing protein, partial [Candidatus Aenigmatarchaeota archaeon]
SQITTGMSQNFVIEAVSGKQITIRNTGQTPITNFAIYVDEKPINFTNSSKIVNPGEIYTFFVYDFIDYSYPRTLKITIPGVVQTKQVGKENSDPSLIGYWKFDDSDLTKDYSIYENRANIIGTLSFIPGKYGNAASANNAGNYINLLPQSYTFINNSIKNGFTFSFWFKVNGNSTSAQWPISLGPSGRGGTHVYPGIRFANYSYSYPYLEYGLYPNCTGESGNFTALNFPNYNPIILSEWQYAAFTYNGSYMKSYYNGIFYSNKIQIGICTDNMSDFRIVNFNGTLDEVQIWNRALTPEEVLNHYLHGPV